MSDRWIVIPNWDPSTDPDGVKHDGFQHYPDRDPKWIKTYRTLLAKDEFLSLSFHLRGVLMSVWLEYAAANRQLRDSTLTLTRRLGQRVTTRDLETLNRAGWITFSASAPIAPRYTGARLEKKKKEKEPRVGAEPKAAPPTWQPALGSSNPAATILREIGNGSIADGIDLDAAFRAHPHLTAVQRDDLRASLPTALPADATASAPQTAPFHPVPPSEEAA